MKRPRLRIPAVLAVAVVGTSATVTLTFSGCGAEPGPEPIDANRINSVKVDAGVDAVDAPDARPPI
ncbi:MAG TPA: hypothetical protein VMZ53_12495 [Kofleriaceae bacterium]|nr:hypothetical protein [Kofleriaceae bacterium]